jgi:hypothetical protein
MPLNHNSFYRTTGQQRSDRGIDILPAGVITGRRDHFRQARTPGSAGRFRGLLAADRESAIRQRREAEETVRIAEEQARQAQEERIEAEREAAAEVEQLRLWNEHYANEYNARNHDLPHLPADTVYWMGPDNDTDLFAPVDDLAALRYQDIKDCVICMEPLGEQGVIMLPCEHPFHEQCLRGWWYAQRRFVCPICRRVFLVVTRTQWQRDGGVEALREQLPRLARALAPHLAPAPGPAQVPAQALAQGQAPVPEEEEEEEELPSDEHIGRGDRWRQWPTIYERHQPPAMQDDDEYEAA